MTDDSSHIIEVPQAQSAVQAKCFHPAGGFVEFTQEEVEQSISNRFEKMALLHSNRTAVESGNQSVTYDELNRLANRIAHALLVRLGMREERIVLLVEQDAPLIAAILGVLKAGKVFVVLDPSFPEARLAYMLADSQAGAVLCSSRSLSLAKELEADTSRLMNIDELDVGLSVDNPQISVRPERLSYIVYTSGSTGRPKGVMQNHRNSLHEAMVYGNGLRVSMHDRMALLYSCSTSQGLKIVFAALLNGAALYLFDLKKGGFNLLADWLARERITIYCSIPIVFRELASVLNAQHLFPNLRVIQLGSDAVTPREIDDYRRHFAATAILVIRLGSSEAGTLRRLFIDGETPPAYRGVRVGYPVEDTEILLLDAVDSGKAAGANEPGEIAARSRYLSPGYWQLPELTAARFQPALNGDERIYLTGDLGRALPDGCLEYIGRKDHEVKVRGYTVAIVEIEAALLSHDSVKEAVVVTREGASAERQLVAYLVATGKPVVTVSELRTFLKGRLPDYMVPSAFVTMDALPVLPGGKVDRQALPVWISSRPALQTVFVAPRTRAEEIIAGIWSEVLSLDEVGVDDNFLDLGGHSLAATRVVSRVIEEFQIELPLEVVFQSPTVARMAGVITGYQAKALGEERLDGLIAELESITDEGARDVLKAGSQRLPAADRPEDN
jgi:amino acid adenylation domain-containing protein